MPQKITVFPKREKSISITTRPLFFKNKEILNSIFFLKIFLAISVCYYHAVSFMNQIYGKFHLPGWNATRENVSVAVDCFFILSGFLLTRRFGTNIHTYIKNRLIRLLPAFYISIVLSYLLFFCGANVQWAFKQNQTLNTLVQNLFLLNLQFKHILLTVSWFIYPLFWISLGYIILKKYLPDALIAIIICISIAVSYNIVASYGIYVWRIVHELPVGFYRGFGGIGTGILLNLLYHFLTPFVQKIKSSIIFALAEITLLFLLIELMFVSLEFHFFSIIGTFSVLLLLCLYKNPYTEKLLNHAFIKKANDMSYMLFLFHATVFGTMQSIFKYFKIIPQNPFLYFCILLLSALIVCSILHNYIEKPIVNYLNFKLLRKRTTS